MIPLIYLLKINIIHFDPSPNPKVFLINIIIWLYVKRRFDYGYDG